MVERVFLTETRRKVLEGEFEGSDATKRSHKSRIRTRARMALQELTEVAQSSEIDNADVFDPKDVTSFTESLIFNGRSGGITPMWNWEGDDYDDYYAEYAYQRQLAHLLSHQMDSWDKMLSFPERPGKTTTGLISEEHAEQFEDELGDIDIEEGEEEEEGEGGS